MTEPSHAVFVSYASQDAESAQKIGEALRAAGIAVFLDQSELRGGDVWDQKIRREIHDCALFIPVISSNTASRHEGYFRFEWDLADQRTHMMARNRVFIVPVCLDTSAEAGADVPDSFQRVQWTRLAGGVTPPAFVERIRRLLSGEPTPPSTGTASVAARMPDAPSIRNRFLASWRSKPAVLALIAVLAMVLGYLAANRLVQSKRGAEVGAAGPPPAQSAPVTAFSPPPHSIAVLPFVNLSGDANQDYFSDGLTEELLNSLADINELQVAARTSSFSFKEHPDIATVAHKLNVGAVLEGSVRRSANTIRITAQLINAVTGFHMWSKTYDRDLGDVLKLQTAIATEVAGALKVRLLGDEATKIEMGGTSNPTALDAYLRGARAYSLGHDAPTFQNAIFAYTEAIRIDPHYALAFAGRSRAEIAYALQIATGYRQYFDRAQEDARQAVKLAPELAECRLSLALYLSVGALDFSSASSAFEDAMKLAPGNAAILVEGGRNAVYMGHFDVGLAAARRAVVLDPINPRTRAVLAQALYSARRYEEAVAAFGEVISLEPDYDQAYGIRGLAYYGLRDFENARSSCESRPDYWTSRWCLAVAYEKLGRHVDAEAVLKKFQSESLNSPAYQYATIYAQWGNTGKALDWLTTALRLRDPGLVYLKTDTLMDPLRKEPRLQAIERELNFPD